MTNKLSGGADQKGNCTVCGEYIGDSDIHQYVHGGAIEKHTPTPWEYVDYSKDGERLSIDGENNTIAEVFNTEGNLEANAAFIVKACNSHEALKDMLHAVLDDLKSGRLTHVDGTDSAIEEVEDVLKLVGEEV
jgi:hypothetical protein